MYYNGLSIFKIITVIYVTCSGTKEPEDEQVCKAVVVLFNTYIKPLDLLKQCDNITTTALHNTPVVQATHTPIQVNEIFITIDIEKLATNYDALYDLPTVQTDNANMSLEDALPIDTPHLEQNLMSLLEFTPEKVVKLQKNGTFCKHILNMYIAVKKTTTSQTPWASYIRKLLISVVHFQHWSYHKSLLNTYFMLHIIL